MQSDNNLIFYNSIYSLIQSSYVQ